MRVYMGYPDADSEREILRAEAGAAQIDTVQPVLTGADILEMQQVVTQVEVDDSLIKYALDIVRRTRQHEKLTLGVSPRGSQMLYRAAQAMAFLDGRGFCVPEDFKPLAVSVFAHRVAIHGMHSSGMKKSVRAEEVIQEIVDSVPVPV
jgi:MoxR-like ATPase